MEKTITPLSTIVEVKPYTFIYEKRHALPAEECERIAEVISVGALRYFLLRFARNTIIAFDFKEASEPGS